MSRRRQRSQPPVVAPQPQQSFTDGFRNAAARMGFGEQNLLSASHYSRSNKTRDWQSLTAMYRTAWIAGVAVDVVAHDMTRAGATFAGDVEADDLSDIASEFQRLQIWSKIANLVKWSRLYGGAIAIMLIDGQDVSTPLDVSTVGKDGFKGLMVLDRWMLQPSITDYITDMGPDLGKPKFYGVLATAPGLQGQWVHHSRVIRMEGIELPYQESLNENGWGESVIERLWDRMVAFDSATMGTAQLVYKAYLRTIRIKGLRGMIGAGGAAMKVVAEQMDFMRLAQTNEGMTVLDADDAFETTSYTFAGLDGVIMQMAQQLAGALQIPLVRLLGISPGGIGSNGNSELSTYYDGTNQKQVQDLTLPMLTIFRLIYQNLRGVELEGSLTVSFNSLWQLTDEQKADIAQKVTNAVVQVAGTGLISDRTALMELRQSSRTTGVWSQIQDDDIENADPTLPEPGGEGELPNAKEPDDDSPPDKDV